MENNNRTPQHKLEAPIKPPRSPGPRAQSPNTPYTRIPLMQDLPQHQINERFCVTPESMGLERSDTPTPRQQQATKQTPQVIKSEDIIQQQEQSSNSSSNLNSSLQTLKSTGEINVTSALPPTTTAHICQRPHLSHTNLEHMKLFSDLPTSYYDQLVGGAAGLNECLNDVYRKRLQEIDANAYGDKDLKLATYQEWVNTLEQINASVLKNMDELETEVSERLEMMQRRVNTNCRHSQGNELMKCRKDIDTLIKLIQIHYNNWDLQGITFESITKAQLLGLTEQQLQTMNPELGGAYMENTTGAESMHKNKLLANMQALAFEVAQKHDEVRELKRQVNYMEDEVQNAQKKIQFKDDVIKDLRNDLKCAHNKLTHSGSMDASIVPSINFESQTSGSVTTLSESNQLMYQDNVSEFESLSHTELEEQQKIKTLQDELYDLFAISKEWTNNTKQKMENLLKRLTNETEKAGVHNKLNYIRRQLISLASANSESVNDCDSGFDSKSENDQDAKILDLVRKRLCESNKTIHDLRMRVQKLEIHNNELSTSIQSEKSYSQRNSQTLKQLADLLCEMMGQQFSYTDIYKSQSEINPFCEGIIDMKKGFQERETELLNTLEIRNHEIEELNRALLTYEQQKPSLNIIDLEHLNKTTPPPTTPPPPIPTSAATLLTGQAQQNTTSLQGLNENQLKK